MDSGTDGHRESSAGVGSPINSTPQKAPRAAPASRDGNSPHLAAANPTDASLASPSRVESAGNPPGVSAMAIQ